MRSLQDQTLKRYMTHLKYKRMLNRIRNEVSLRTTWVVFDVNILNNTINILTWCTRPFSQSKTHHKFNQDTCDQLFSQIHSLYRMSTKALCNSRQHEDTKTQNSVDRNESPYCIQRITHICCVTVLTVL